MALHETGRALGHRVVVHGALGLLDEAEHVAHAQNAVGHPVGVEEVEVGQPLTRAGEGDRLADDALDGEGRATAGVTVELGEDDRVEREASGGRPWRSPRRPGRSWRR